MATCPQVVWLASFGDGKRVAGGHRVQHTWINAEADGDPYVQSCLRSYEEEQGLEAGAIIDRFVSGSEMVALVYLQPCAQHHPLLPLCREMRAQFDLWNHIGDGDLLDQGLFYFHVLKAQPILHHVSLLDAETKSGRHACFFCMDKVWAQRCFTASVLGVDDATFQVWRGLTEGKVPLLPLKVPKSIAFLLANRMWTKLAVPEKLTNMRLVAGWHVKHIVRAPPGCRRPLFISRVWRLNLDNFLGFNSETWMGFTPMLAFNQLPRRGQGCGEALGSV